MLSGVLLAEGCVQATEKSDFGERSSADLGVWGARLSRKASHQEILVEIMS